MKKNELSYKDLKNVCNPNVFKFETTDELDGTDAIYGQDRGIKALEFGLNVDIKDFGDIALQSKAPARIAGRCGVFAESDLIHKQQLGYAVEDLLYGL